ncbi:hypothetical protein HNQ35_002548 [Cerasibacillus quisquiliarum]|mgnify:CR=1 FL=1|uniref:Uncharacterized protein n=1 Tax=Cerasibacillus quisquiliarum TaxID=227865 RepID=A0A511V247_9BACI|nr:hypothetical protein [Cerasibacillus quisquiliarum]GEN32101.1 hypothetical protein CQU01_23390 [Cerasibacillus quisquiliarum]
MIYDDKNKTITTNRLILRLFQKTDAPAVAKLCNNYNIYKNTLYLPFIQILLRKGFCKK